MFSIEQEPTDAKLDLSTEPESLVEAFVHYLYHTDYKAPLGSGIVEDEA